MSMKRTAFHLPFQASCSLKCSSQPLPTRYARGRVGPVGPTHNRHLNHAVVRAGDAGPFSVKGDD